MHNSLHSGGVHAQKSARVVQCGEFQCRDFLRPQCKRKSEWKTDNVIECLSKWKERVGERKVNRKRIKRDAANTIENDENNLHNLKKKKSQLKNNELSERDTNNVIVIDCMYCVPCCGCDILVVIRCCQSNEIECVRCCCRGISVQQTNMTTNMYLSTCLDMKHECARRHGGGGYAYLLIYDARKRGREQLTHSFSITSRISVQCKNEVRAHQSLVFRMRFNVLPNVPSFVLHAHTHTQQQNILFSSF